MNLFRIHADETGETHLLRVDLPQVQGPGDLPRRVGVRDVPTTTLSISELLERKPDVGLHPAPRRQIVVVLRGALEISTTSGDRTRLEPGDCLLADDVDGLGHTTRDVGDEPLGTLTVGVAEEWAFP